MSPFRCVRVSAVAGFLRLDVDPVTRGREGASRCLPFPDQFVSLLSIGPPIASSLAGGERGLSQLSPARLVHFENDRICGNACKRRVRDGLVRFRPGFGQVLPRCLESRGVAQSATQACTEPASRLHEACIARRGTFLGFGLLRESGVTPRVDFVAFPAAHVEADVARNQPDATEPLPNGDRSVLHLASFWRRQIDRGRSVVLILVRAWRRAADLHEPCTTPASGCIATASGWTRGRSCAAVGGGSAGRAPRCVQVRFLRCCGLRREAAWWRRREVTPCAIGCFDGRTTWVVRHTLRIGVRCRRDWRLTAV